MVQYLTIYTDKSGRVETVIKNSFSENGTYCLDIEIDGIPFKGSGFDDFELIEPTSYNKNQLKRFSFNKVPKFQSKEFSWHLCNCSFDVRIPGKITNTDKELDTDAFLKMQLHLGKPKSNGGIDQLIALFELAVDDLKFSIKSDNFETAMEQIQKEMTLKYRFKNCYACHFSDYSPAGNGFFGSMMCFRNNKTPYLTATSKEEHFKVAGLGFIAVQETYLCNEFEPREKDTGYRGWPFD